MERLDVAVAFDHFLGLEPSPAVHVGRLPKRVTVGIQRLRLALGLRLDLGEDVGHVVGLLDRDFVAIKMIRWYQVASIETAVGMRRGFGLALGFECQCVRAPDIEMGRISCPVLLLAVVLCQQARSPWWCWGEITIQYRY